MADEEQRREFGPGELRLGGEQGGEGVVCEGFEGVVCGRFVGFGSLNRDGGAVTAGGEGQNSCVGEEGTDLAGEEGEGQG